MKCPYCHKKLYMQGGQFIVKNKPVTHGFCENKKCSSYGKAIRFILNGKIRRISKK